MWKLQGARQQNQTFGKQDNNNLILSFYHERFKLPIYNDFKQTYLYHDRFTQIDLKVQHTYGQHSALGSEHRLNILC